MVKCPICDSEKQKEFQFTVKFLDPKTNTTKEIPAQGYECLNCGEDWQSAQQHHTYAQLIKLQGN